MLIMSLSILRLGWTELNLSKTIPYRKVTLLICILPFYQSDVADDVIVTFIDRSQRQQRVILTLVIFARLTDESYGNSQPL